MVSFTPKFYLDDLRYISWPRITAPWKKWKKTKETTREEDNDYSYLRETKQKQNKILLSQ